MFIVMWMIDIVLPQEMKLDKMKLKEHQKMKILIATQEDQINYLKEEVDNLVQVSGYLKNQVGQQLYHFLHKSYSFAKLLSHVLITDLR